MLYFQGTEFQTAEVTFQFNSCFTVLALVDRPRRGWY